MSLTTDFQSIDVATINRYVDEGREEDLHLDFKIAGAAMKREDRENLAKALSGFANSDGGLIIWGVDARRGQGVDDPDCAREKKPIGSLRLFLSRLNEITSSAVNPAVDGIQHKSVPLSNEFGYAVTLVPSSDGGPYMAKQGLDRYYKRSGSSFLRMEHFEIADMFGRRARPILSLATRVISGGNPMPGSYWPYRLVLSLSNSGRGSARAPYLAFKAGSPWFRYEYGIDGNGSEGLRRLPSASDSRQVSYGGDLNAVVHPGTSLDVAAISTSLLPSGAIAPLSLSYSLAADGVPVADCELQLSSEQLGDLIV